ncbi:MAG: hypothetical protein KDK99_14395, partial [Verrucomicrobiales bacterium]|nr:hypothetical protein [Verrucomicrobiales bacterium]
LFQLIGHARYRNDDAGRATLWYDRAALFAPRNAELRQNLNFLQEQNRFLTFPPSSLFTDWSLLLKQNEWLLLAGIGFALLLLPIAWMQLSRCCRGTLAATSALGGILLATAIVFLWLRPQGSTRVANLEIVTEKDVAAHTSATLVSSSVIDLPPGSQVRLIEKRGDWSYCEIPYQRENLRGWIETAVLTPLWPYDARWLP